MNLSHRDAFALIQQAVDGPLSQVARTELDRHLADCPQCQADAALFRGLKDYSKRTISLLKTFQQKSTLCS